MRKTRTKRTIGASALALSLLLAGGVFPAAAEKKNENAVAVVGGTVFREPGFALPGAEVSIEMAKPGSKFKKRKAVTDARGEFAFRVSPEEATYKLAARANGHAPEERTVTVSGLQHLDVFFQLKPLAK